MADRYNGKYIDREYVNGQWAGIKAGPMPVAYTGSINDPDKIRNTSLIIPNSATGSPTDTTNTSYAVTTVRYGSDAYIQQAIGLTDLSTRIRYYNGTSWSSWIAGNDNTDITDQLAVLTRSVSTLSTGLSNTTTIANSAKNAAATNANSISRIDGVNATQNNNISVLQSQMSAVNSKVVMHSEASKICVPGNASADCINSWTSGVLQMHTRGRSSVFRKQASDASVPITQSSIPSGYHCSVFDFDFNGKMAYHSDTSGFVWSWLPVFMSLCDTVEGKTGSGSYLPSFSSWPTVEITDSTGTSFYITGANEYSGLTLFITNESSIQIGRIMNNSSSYNFAAFNHATYTRNGPCLIKIKGTINRIYAN